MEAKGTPDWQRSARDLQWSWHKATDRHRAALGLQKRDQEGAGFDLLMNIQRENPSVQQDYQACRAADGDRFWQIASEASRPRRVPRSGDRGTLPPLPAEEAARLDTLRSYAVLDTPPEEATDDLTRLAAQICGTPVAMLSLVDGERQWIKSKVGTDLTETPRDVAFCAHAILQPDLFVIPDAQADKRFMDNPLVTSGPHIRFYAGAPLLTPEGHALGTICTVDHVPHELSPDQQEALRALARQAMTQFRLRRSLKQLQELEALRDSLTHMIVHDLRTPLTSLIGGLQMLERLGELNEDQKEFLGMSMLGGQTLLGMINDLLDIGKLEDGSLNLEYSRLTVGAVVEQAQRQVAHLAAQKNLTLPVELAPGLPPVYADEAKLVRTLVNLLGNAIKFTPADGTVTLSVRPSEGERALRFAVTDTGEGIPAEAFARIFEKFGQVEGRTSGRKMSTGLGLAFCKLAVEAHGGTIGVESTSSQGSTFWFTLPSQAPPTRGASLVPVGDRGTPPVDPHPWPLASPPRFVSYFQQI